jgi:regulator of replication initiation timing
LESLFHGLIHFSNALLQLKKDLSDVEEKIGQQTTEIEALKTQLQYYEKDLGFKKNVDIPRVRKPVYMLDDDFPVDRMMQRPPDEARMFVEAQHNKNLGTGK